MTVHFEATAFHRHGEELYNTATNLRGRLLSEIESRRKRLDEASSKEEDQTAAAAEHLERLRSQAESPMPAQDGPPSALIQWRLSGLQHDIAVAKENLRHWMAEANLADQSAKLSRLDARVAAIDLILEDSIVNAGADHQQEFFDADAEENAYWLGVANAMVSFAKRKVAALEAAERSARTALRQLERAEKTGRKKASTGLTREKK